MDGEPSPADAISAKLIRSDEIVQQAFKRIATGSALLFVGIIFSKLFGFLSKFTIIRFLSPEDYGLFALGFSMVSLFIILGQMGLHSGSQRYIAFFQGKDDKASTRGVILSTTRILVISSIVTTLAAIMLAGPISVFLGKPELKEVILWLATLIPLTICVEIIASFYMGFQRVGVKVFLQSIGLPLLSLTTIFLFLLIYRSLESAVIALSFSYFLIAIICLLYSLWHFPISLIGKDRLFMGRRLLAFSLPLFAVYSLASITTQTDTLMLGYLSSVRQVGIYNSAAILAAFIPVFLAPITLIYLPVASGLVAHEYHLELKTVYRSATKWLFIFTLPLLLVFFLYSESVLGLAFGDNYLGATRALQLLCLGEFIHTFLGPNSTTLIAYGNSKVLMFNFGISAVTNITLNLLFIPRWGISGAAAASFISLALINVLNSGYIFRRYGVHPFSSSYVKAVILLLTASAFLYFPLLKLLNVSKLFLLTYYPLFLIIGFCVILLTNNLEDRDKAFIAEIRRRLFNS